MRRSRGCWLGVVVWTACTATHREDVGPSPVVPAPPVVATAPISVAEPRPPEPVIEGPAWRRELAAAEASRRGQADYREIEALERKAAATIEGLPDDDPQILEALCLAGSLSLLSAGERTAMWERAVALEARRTHADMRGQYASLARGTPRFQVEYEYGLITFTDSPIGSKPRLSPGSLLLPTTQDEDCARADRVYLRLQLVDAWSSAGMAGAMVAANGRGGAAEAKKYATAAALFVDLYDRAVRDLGAEDPRLATFYDYGHAYCDRVTRRSHGGSVCMPERRALERALALREKGFGADHPLTNSSRISLGGVLLAAGEKQRSEELIKKAAAVRPGSVETISALRTLAGIHLHRGENMLAERAAADAAQLARNILSPQRDSWEFETTLAYHARLAAAAGFYDKSAAAYSVAQQGKSSQFAYELAEVLRAARKDAEALAAYDVDLQSIEKEDARGIDWYAASRMVRSQQGKIAILEKTGRTAELTAARERLTRLQELARPN